MKSILLPAFCFLFLSVLLKPASAQEKPPLPAGPLPARAPDLARWEITYTYTALAKPTTATADNVPNPAVLQESSVTKSGTTYQQSDKFDNGTTTTRWWVNGTVLGISGNGSYVVSDVIDNGPFSFQNSDFPDLTWIGADCYTRVETIENTTCFVFEKLRPNASDADLHDMSPEDRAAAEKKPIKTTVWINSANGLPVQESTLGQNIVYIFLPAPTAPTLPPAAAQVLALYQAREAQLTRRGPPP